MRICRLIYPLPDVQLTRQWPLEVLALGISRAGTESLRNALVELGYEDVHHGVRFILSDQERLQWLRLAWAQHTNNPAGLTTAEFDKVLGDCAAVTDNPSCGFAHELLTAYPEAKVILNYRDDVDQWYESMMELEKLGREQTWRAYILSWFQTDLFWQQHVATYWLRGRHVPGGFKKNGKKWYAEHYASLEERLTKEGRPFLKWKVDDALATVREQRHAHGVPALDEQDRHRATKAGRGSPRVLHLRGHARAGDSGRGVSVLVLLWLGERRRAIFECSLGLEPHWEAFLSKARKQHENETRLEDGGASHCV
nr:hypothetical protein CFP56_02763 [Quercus suber]